MSKRTNTGPIKKNQSSIQVLKTLLKLMENDYTMEELVEALNRDEKNKSLFNNSVVSKYINTCRFCGIKIPKIHNVYTIASIPFGMDISDREYDLLQLLQASAKSVLSIKANNEFGKFITKLSKYSNRNIIKIDEETISLIEKEFIKASELGHKVHLLYKEHKDAEGCPIGIVEKNEKKYFRIYCNNKEKNIPIDRLAGIEILHDRCGILDQNEDIMFKLTGGLALRYEARPHERLIDNHRPDYIVILNSGENVNEFIPRILRYDTLCEVKSPIGVRKEVKKIIDETLANYGE